MYSKIDYVCKAHRELRKLAKISLQDSENLYYAFEEALKELLDYYSQKYSLRYFSMDMNNLIVLDTPAEKHPRQKFQNTVYLFLSLTYI